MLRDDAVNLIALQLGNRTDLNATIITAMQLVQDTELEATGVLMPWFLLTESASTVLAAGEARVALPNDFILEDEDWGLGIEDENGVIKWLRKEDYDVLQATYGDGTGKPKYYSLNGSYFYMFPKNPDADEVIHMRYYARADNITSGNIENAWLKHAPDAVMAYTGFYIADRILQNAELASKFAAAKQAAFVRLVTHNESRMHANRQYRMGDE